MDDDTLPIEFPDESFVLRSRIFVMIDGAFVVRWSDTLVQELVSGQYRAFEKTAFGAPITDFELKQLMTAGLVKGFDRDHVHLNALPDQYKESAVSAWEQARKRSYYLNTLFDSTHVQEVIRCLVAIGLQDEFYVRVRDDFVILWSHQGRSFPKFDDADKARQALLTKAPQMFEQAVVAFIEVGS
ncbi:MAG: hypothetical protein SH821_07835 [Phototrophicales bacterium]|nr:hypothetical protein [Phototrophicales bacterium]